MCYNITSGSPPVRECAGRDLNPHGSFLPADPKSAVPANYTTSAYSENQGEGSLSDRPSPESPNINDIPVYSFCQVLFVGYIATNG